MMPIGDLEEINFDAVPVDPFWNLGEGKEFRMHRIHAYPAKFPAFITTKALDYAKKHAINVVRMADIFCGCGTAAFEAKRCNIDFWGCDINPVATMIAKVKSRKYQTRRLRKYYQNIVASFINADKRTVHYEHANERLKYWYDPEHFEDLYRLKAAIEKSTSNRGYYRLFFYCAFSNILKSTSRWLTKAIKPQIDPDKKPADVLKVFKHQCEFMIRANEESDIEGFSEVKISTGNFLTYLNKPKVDMIVTSPPYVTSYEYADLHQLSSLWLGFSEDYRQLRKGSIGSRYLTNSLEQEQKYLNTTGRWIIQSLNKECKSKARSITKYFLDMQKTAEHVYLILNDGGAALFVIGNTEYKGIKVDNVRHLAESLRIAGFRKMCVTKRRISNKYFTPYRDKEGRFTRDSNSRKIYGEEFILIAEK
jgi:methylase of polypeptide subunit release factors